MSSRTMDFYWELVTLLESRVKYLSADPRNQFYQGEVTAIKNVLQLFRDVFEIEEEEENE